MFGTAGFLERFPAWSAARFCAATQYLFGWINQSCFKENYILDTDPRKGQCGGMSGFAIGVSLSLAPIFLGFLMEPWIPLGHWDGEYYYSLV